MTLSDQIKQRIQKFSPLKAQSYAPPQTCGSSSNGFLGKFLGCSLVIMTVVTVLMVVSKSPGVSASERPAPAAPAYVTKADLKALADSINRRLDRMDGEIKTANHHAWLLAMAHNENVALTRQYGPCSAAQLVFFDENWKLNRMPYTMRLTEDQLKAIQTSVRTAQPVR